MGKQIAWVLTVFIIVLMGCRDDKKNPNLKVGLDFTLIFDITKLTTIQGIEEQPVFTFGEPILANGYLYFPDRVSSFVYKYSLDGNLVDHFGGRGRGPGDLADPLGISLTLRNTLLVNELGNIRLQEFDLEGNSLSLTVLPSFSFSVLTDNDKNLVWCIFPLMTADGSKAIHLVDIQDGFIRKSIAPYNEESVFTHGWVAATVEEKIFLANILDREIKGYSKSGSDIQKINLESPETVFFDTGKKMKQAETKESLMEGVKRLREETYTSIEKILIVNDWIIVVHRRHNMPEKSDFFIDIFDSSGMLHYSGINIPGKLINLGNDRYAIMKKSEEQLGHIELNLIQLKL